MRLILMLSILNLGRINCGGANTEENLPTLCHVCKHTVAEFLEELDKSAKSRDVLQLGHVLQSDKPKTIVYSKSGLRLIEALENTCGKMTEYKVHKDKPNHSRYAKDESSTFTTLKNLKKRGVKVDLGFPDEMWDTPDAEVFQLKRQCETLVERYEEDLNDWYFNHQENNLYDWFCKDNILKGKDHACLEDLNSSHKRRGKKKVKEENDGGDDGDGYGDSESITAGDEEEMQNQNDADGEDKAKETGKSGRTRKKTHKSSIDGGLGEENLVKDDEKQKLEHGKKRNDKNENRSKKKSKNIKRKFKDKKRKKSKTNQKKKPKLTREAEKRHSEL